MTPNPGTYILLLKSVSESHVVIGKWGKLAVLPGWYLYVGSAFGPGGIRARVSRHCRTEKTCRWHVDYLRKVTTLASVWYSHAPERLEHEWAAAVRSMRGAEPVAGFGCSDCRCESHLFFFADPPSPAAFSDAAGHHVDRWACEAET